MSKIYLQHYPLGKYCLTSRIRLFILLSVQMSFFRLPVKPPDGSGTSGGQPSPMHWVLWHGRYPPWPTGDGAPTVSRLSTHIGLLTHRRAGVNSCGRATSAPCILRTNGMGELYVFSLYRSPFKYPRFRPGIFLLGVSLRWDADFALMLPVKHFWAVCLMVACFFEKWYPTHLTTEAEYHHVDETAGIPQPCP